MSIAFELSPDSIHMQALIPFDSIVVAHPRVKAALDGIGRSLAWAEVSKEPRGVVILGEGGTGKTTICNAVLKRFPRYDIDVDDAVTSMVPAFVCSVPAGSNIKGLASSMLEGLGDPTPDEGSQKDCTTRLLSLLKKCKTRVILLDEFHNLVNMSKPTKRSAETACAWLIQLINKSKVTVCLVGMPECENLVDYEDQMTRRFDGRYPLGDLLAGSEDQPGELSGYLHALASKIEELMSIRVRPDSLSHHFLNQVWAATGGRPGIISLLYKTAMLEAIRGARDDVMTSDFAAAFDTGCSIKFALVSENPFSMKKVLLAKALFREVK